MFASVIKMVTSNPEFYNEIAANGGAAPGDKHPLAGRSGIYDPWGEILAQAGGGEEIISAQLDFSALQESRSKIPVRKDKKCLRS